MALPQNKYIAFQGQIKSTQDCCDLRNFSPTVTSQLFIKNTLFPVFLFLIIPFYFLATALFL